MLVGGNEGIIGIIDGVCCIFSASSISPNLLKKERAKTLIPPNHHSQQSPNPK